MGLQGLEKLCAKKFGQVLRDFGRRVLGPELVPCSAKSMRKKNYKEVLVEKEGCFYFGTHALLAIKIAFAYIRSRPLKFLLFSWPLSL